MANARTRYDTMAAYLERTHEVTQGQLYGKPCLRFEGDPFAVFHNDTMGFRLHGRSLTQALLLPDVRGWDPLHPERSSPGWVAVAAPQFQRWDRLVLEALRCARELRSGYVTSNRAAPIASTGDPPPSTAENLAKRATAALKSSVAGLTLSPAPPPRAPVDE